MKGLLHWLAVLPLLSSLVLAACAPPSQIQVNLDKEFTLSPGQTATVSGQDLQIKFIQETADSRCPKGVQCIWAGEVSCTVQVTKAGSTVEVVLTESGAGDHATKSLDGYEVAFHVTPYPEAGKTIKPGDYRLTMTVGKE